MNSDLTLSPETDAVLQLLKAIPLGGEVTYRRLSDACGRDVTKAGRSTLASARDIALRSGVAFTSIRKVGLRRITVDEAPGIGATARSRIVSTSRRGIKAMRAIVTASNGASPETSRRLSSEIAALGLLAEAAQDSVQPALETAQHPMSVAEASQAFLRHIGAVPEAGV